MKKKYITPTEYSEILEKRFGESPTLTTIRNWCLPIEEGGKGIGVKVGGRWKVDVSKLSIILKGEK